MAKEDPDRIRNRGPRTTIRRIIARLERHQREAAEIVLELRQLESGAPIDISEVASLDSFEKRLIDEALLQAKGNQSEAARILHISRDRLRYKIAKYRLVNRNYR